MPLTPTSANGLNQPSEVAVDNLQTFSIKRIGSVIGSLDSATMNAVDEALRFYFGLY